MAREGILLGMENLSSTSPPSSTTTSFKNTAEIELLTKLMGMSTTAKNNTTASTSTTPKVAPRKIVSAANRYADVHEVEVHVSLSHRVSAWTEAELAKLKTYNVTQLDDERCVLWGKAVVSSLLEENITADTVTMMLGLAVSLKNPDDMSKHLLTEPTAGYGTKMAIPEPADKLLSLPRWQQRDMEPMPYQAAAYCYLAAYLMRLQCRPADSVKTSMAVLKERFKGCYDNGHAVLRHLEFSSASLESIKIVMARKPEMVGTWVLWLAYNENENTELARQSRGMLEYLGLQIFAYQGMHVVTLILAIQQTTGVPMGMLLREMDCPVTRAGVQEVDNIIKNHEITDRHPARKTYFRYARVWDNGYFSKIQSKNCKELLYLAAKTYKGISSNPRSDPTKIYALQSLGEAFKARLDEVSEKLRTLLLAHARVDSESGSVWS